MERGDTYTCDREVPIRFRRMAEDPEGNYLIPVFTSREELEKGESSSVIHQTFGDLVKALDRWPQCRGLVINPWDKRMLLTKESLEIVKKHIRNRTSALSAGAYWMCMRTRSSMRPIGACWAAAVWMEPSTARQGKSCSKNAGS